MSIGVRTMHPSFLRTAAGDRRLRAGLVALSLLALTGCSNLRESLPSLPNLAGLSVHRIDVVQGNVVTREQAQALQTGMPRQQVRDILGTPLLASVFHADRWDYVFSFRRQGQPPQQRRLTVFFKGDLLERVEGDELPSETEFVASLDVRRPTGKVLPLEATEEQLKAFEARNPARSSAPTGTDARPAASYPPLESPAR